MHQLNETEIFGHGHSATHRVQSVNTLHLIGYFQNNIHFVIARKTISSTLRTHWKRL